MRRHQFSARRAANTLSAPVALAILLGTGCVTSGSYDELEAEQQATTRELSDARARVFELEGDLAAAARRGSDLAGTVAEQERALAELRQRQAQTQKRIAEYRELTSKFRALVDAGKLRVRVVNGRMLVQMQTDVLFSSGSAALSREGRKAIEEVSGLLVSLADRRYQVEGHTDDVPIRTATFPSNWELAAARAITVLNVMLGSDMAPERVSAVSYGETLPIASNETPEGRAQNRRIEIVVVPDLSQLPGAEALEALSRER